MILILGGTTEGRMAVRVADEANQPYFYSTKGEGQQVTCAHGTRLSGAMDVEAMTRFCRKQQIRLLIDAAHPFAQALHQTIFEVSQRLQLPVVRLERRYPPRDPSLHWCTDYADAMNQMEADGIEQLVALSGVNTLRPLKPFWEKHPCWFRILQREESLRIADQQGFPRERLLFYPEEGTADQADFELPATVLHDKKTAILTKESGYSGGFEAKVEAAKQRGIPLYVVQRPALPETFYYVYGEEGLRKRIERLVPEFYPLKSGYTTGCCATAASKAALQTLLSGVAPTEVEIALPSGEWISLPIEQTTLSAQSATSTVRKESGDDPDVTNHAAICATVAWHTPNNPDDRIRFKAGEALSENQTEGCSVYPNAVKKDGVCKYYKAYKTILTAWGFRKIMENIKVTDANAIRQELRLFFGNNSRYYRYFNGKRRLTEKQKVWIEKLFESYGYADMQFDRYLEEVDI